MGKYEIFSSDARNAEIEGVSFRNTSLLDSGLLMCLDAVMRDDYESKTTFDSDRIIYELVMGDLVIEYTNPEARDADKENFKNISIDTSFKLQKPEYSGEFELNGKYYLILGVNVRLEGETTESLYKGVVVNPGRYLDDRGVPKVIEAKQDIVNRALES